MKLKTILSLSLVALILGGLASCSKPSGPMTQTEKIESAKTFLTGKVVLSAHAFMGEKNLTGLKTGAPMMYNFEWKADNTLHLKLDGFSVAKMPLRLFFDADLKPVPENQWEKDEMPGDGWIKLYGDNGVTSLTAISPKMPKMPGGTGGKVTMFVNAETHEIQFDLNFNMMGIKAEVFRQKIDPARVNNYEAEKKKFEEDYAAWKKNQGL